MAGNHQIKHWFLAHLRSRRRSQGFSLLEVLVVLVILGVLASLAGPFIGNGMKSMTAKTTLNQLMATMRYCHAKAISSKWVYHVTFSFDENGYQIDTADPHAKTGLIHTDFLFFPPEMGLYEITDQSEEVFNQGQYRVSFYPKGNSSGDLVALKNYHDQILLIKVDQITGRIALQVEQ